ncbi:hypothetical protein Y032_0407g905 [Ancylostoma ceylanicum]|uniref:C-type lectin domain-containing protein n=1 Tax=Ancylostoma ceylanicum TaxID=53326 RepID=A0A016X2Q9_9BILA|nr:hypothetical protein Y032_0407g905 [Ancylostoma ceylanicum]
MLMGEKMKAPGVERVKARNKANPNYVLNIGDESTARCETRCARTRSMVRSRLWPTKASIPPGSIEKRRGELDHVKVAFEHGFKCTPADPCREAFLTLVGDCLSGGGLQSLLSFSDIWILLLINCEASVKSVFVTAYLYKWTCYRHFTTLPNLQIRMLLKCFILSLVATVTVAEYVCPKGHLLDAATKKCYTYIRSSSSYAEARTECKKIGYGLVSIPNEIYNAHIQQISTVFLGMTYGYFWIGFSRQGPKWVWDDGSSSGYTNWAEGNNKGRKCAVMKVADGTWVTADCSRG